MTESICDGSEIVDYADRCASVLATVPGQPNPYKLGLELFRHIEERGDRGQFGPEWEASDDYLAKRRWDRQAGQGLQKVFEVRKLYNDVTFIDTFLTEDFCRRQRLFTFAKDRRRDAWVITSREFEEVKKTLLFRLTNCGAPLLSIVDANYRNRGELHLAHQHDGADLRLDWARKALGALARIWRRPVFVETILEGRARRVGHDGAAPS